MRIPNTSQKAEEVWDCRSAAIRLNGTVDRWTWSEPSPARAAYSCYAFLWLPSDLRRVYSVSTIGLGSVEGLIGCRHERCWVSAILRKGCHADAERQARAVIKEGLLAHSRTKENGDRYRGGFPLIKQHRELFAADPERCARLPSRLGDELRDVSQHAITFWVSA